MSGLTPEVLAPERIAAAFGLWVLWGLVHSLLAAPGVKAWFARALGPKRFALYPLAYSLVSLATFAAAYLLEPPLPQLLWAVDGPAALLLYGVQLAGLALLVWAGMSMHAFKMFGLPQFWAVLRRRAPDEPDVRRDFTSTKAYGLVRHPMHLAGVLILFCPPRMTLGALVFAVFAGLYFLVGTLLEERRLARDLGPVWAEYVRRVPMFLPRLWPRPRA